MNDITHFFSNLFKAENWPPRWHCGIWTEFHGWLYIISDVLIALAYFTIPFLLVHFILRKKNVPFPKIFWLFGTFILACGTTHLIDALIFWVPIYRVSAIVRLLTALASWGTIYALYRILPDAFSLKTPAELEAVVQERTSELHKSVKKIRFLADAMPQIVWTARPDGSRDYFNLPTTIFSGKTLEQLLEWKWVDLIHPDDRDEYLHKWNESLNNGEDFEMEKRLLGADGKYYWHLSRAHAQRDENANIIMWVGTATDIEMQKRANELLEKQVNERTEELRKANIKLANSNDDLENFAAIASHDLQAPLRTITNYLGLIHKTVVKTEDGITIDFITRTIDAASRMSSLINNLLIYARSSTAGLKKEPVDLEEIVELVKENIHELLTEKQGQVKTSGKLPVINADKLQMVQLFQNLIVNGIKYNDKTPLITVSTDENENGYIISVSDNGKGIESQYLSKIFEVFTRLHSDIKGTGLGLSIAQKIIQHHNGKIWVESEINVGTTFFIMLPK